MRLTRRKLSFAHIENHKSMLPSIGHWVYQSVSSIAILSISVRFLTHTANHRLESSTWNNIQFIVVGKHTAPSTHPQPKSSLNDGCEYYGFFVGHRQWHISTIGECINVVAVIIGSDIIGHRSHHQWNNIDGTTAHTTTTTTANIPECDRTVVKYTTMGHMVSIGPCTNSIIHYHIAASCDR